jgi:SAM-dependent methyltransferase
VSADRASFERRRLSFGQVASIYERARPEYPLDAVSWLLEGTHGTVVDLGAGTGKLTRAVCAAGREVVAVEPDAAMRVAFAEALPGIEVLDGTAESIPLPDGSVAAVVAGQAWHWFDVERATSEIARVLAAGRRLAIVWNLRDESVPWVAELGRLLHSGDGASASVRGRDTETFGPLFEPIERRFFRHEQRLEVDELVGLAASRSHTVTLPADEREELLRDVEQLAVRAADGEPLVLPYVVECLRSNRRG